MVLLFLAVHPVEAQGDRELGVAVAGVSVTDFETVRVASGNADGSVFLRMHLREDVFIEPELGFTLVTDGEAMITILNPAFHVGHHFGPRDRGGWFVAGHLAGQVVRFDDVDDVRHGDYAGGASAGYWLPLLDGHASTRIEGRIRHWIDSSTTTMSLSLKAALIF